MEYRSTQERLLESGKCWFSEKGFKSAPLRSIVRDAGFTPGAFYGYYRTKEELFYALTDETAEGFFAIIHKIVNDMDSLPPKRMLFEMTDCYLRHLPELARYICAHKSEIRLLLKGSEGTKYENFLEPLHRLNREKISEAVKRAQEHGISIRQISPETFDLLLHGYFYILSRIALEEKEPDTICRMMTEVALVYKSGILCLMEGAYTGDVR